MAVDGVVEHSGDAMDDDGGGGVEVRHGDRRTVDGEVEPRVVGDDDGLSGEESRQAGVVLEEEELREGEPLRDHVVRERERIAGGGKAVGAVVFGDEEGGAEREDGARHDADPVAEVSGSDQRVNYVVQLVRRCLRGRRRRQRRRRR